jgi:hypothetical protein
LFQFLVAGCGVPAPREALGHAGTLFAPHRSALFRAAVAGFVIAQPKNPPRRPAASFTRQITDMPNEYGREQLLV